MDKQKLVEELQVKYELAHGTRMLAHDEPYEIGDETNHSILDQFFCDLQDTATYKEECGSRFTIFSDYAATPYGEIKILITNHATGKVTVKFVKHWEYTSFLELSNLAVELFEQIAVE